MAISFDVLRIFRSIVLITLSMLILLCVQHVLAAEHNTSSEINFLFCDIGANDDAEVEVRIKKTENEADSRIGLYNLHTKTLQMYIPESVQNWSSPRYSANGKKILFAIEKSKIERAVGILDIEQCTYKEINGGQHVKYMPAFSFDGSSILYWVKDPEKVTYSGRPMHSLYRLNLLNNVESRLTDGAYLLIGHIVELSDKKTIAIGTERLDLFSKESGHEPNSASYVVDKVGSNALLLEGYQFAPGMRSVQFRSGSQNDILIFTAATEVTSGKQKRYVGNIYSSYAGKISQITRFLPSDNALTFRHAAI